ncbi:unnamed protein product [Amoebophrya sp. A25]|nr:unnamed protein product [Amoebophrya sp. A25]|eukprot:GSA25T00005527001.1
MASTTMHPAAKREPFSLSKAQDLLSSLFALLQEEVQGMERRRRVIEETNDISAGLVRLVQQRKKRYYDRERTKIQRARNELAQVDQEVTSVLEQTTDVTEILKTKGIIPETSSSSRTGANAYTIKRGLKGQSSISSSTSLSLNNCNDKHSSKGALNNYNDKRSSTSRHTTVGTSSTLRGAVIKGLQSNSIADNTSSLASLVSEKIAPPPKAAIYDVGALKALRENEKKITEASTSSTKALTTTGKATTSSASSSNTRSSSCSSTSGLFGPLCNFLADWIREATTSSTTSSASSSYPSNKTKINDGRTVVLDDDARLKDYTTALEHLSQTDFLSQVMTHLQPKSELEQRFAQYAITLWLEKFYATSRTLLQRKAGERDDRCRADREDDSISDSCSGNNATTGPRKNWIPTNEFCDIFRLDTASPGADDSTMEVEGVADEGTSDVETATSSPASTRTNRRRVLDSSSTTISASRRPNKLQDGGSETSTSTWPLWDAVYAVSSTSSLSPTNTSIQAPSRSPPSASSPSPSNNTDTKELHLQPDAISELVLPSSILALDSERAQAILAAQDAAHERDFDSRIANLCADLLETTLEDFEHRGHNNVEEENEIHGGHKNMIEEKDLLRIYRLCDFVANKKTRPCAVFREDDVGPYKEDADVVDDQARGQYDVGSYASEDTEDQDDDLQDFEYYNEEPDTDTQHHADTGTHACM